MPPGKVSIDIDADARGVRKGTRDAERSLRRLNRSGSRALGGLKTAGLAAGAAIGVGLAASAKIGLDKLIEDERNLKITEARLRSTGGAANVTAEEVDGLSQALEKQSGISNAVVQEGQNMLLTFTGIRNEVGKGTDVAA